MNPQMRRYVSFVGTGIGERSSEPLQACGENYYLGGLPGMIACLHSGGLHGQRCNRSFVRLYVTRVT